MASSIKNNYFLSEKIHVFPCAYRGEKDPTAKLNTEYNFVNLPHIVDKKSYIIESTETLLKCVIGGYYFEIDLDTEDSLTNKYLCIKTAEPVTDAENNAIEGAHLVRFDSEETGTEKNLDELDSDKKSIFYGLKISDNADTKATAYLKIDASAKLPISASKIENSTGIAINSAFSTQTLNASTASISGNTTIGGLASIKNGLTVSEKSAEIFKANSTGVTSNKPTTINGTLAVKPDGTNAVLNATSEKVTINKPTEVAGDTKITGTLNTTQAIESATSGTFGGKLTVKAGGASITGNTTITGNVSLVKDKGYLDIASNDVKNVKNLEAKKITVDYGNGSSGYKAELYNDSNTIIDIFGRKTANSSAERIFSVDVTTGETYAYKINADSINAKVEGTSSNAVNVTEAIAGTPIDDIFKKTTSTSITALKLKTIDPGTATSSTNPIKIIVDNSINKKAVEFYLDSEKSIVKADTFNGNAATANMFSSEAVIELSGDISGRTSSQKGWTITNTKIANGAVSNTKLKNSSITIGAAKVALGEKLGADSDSAVVNGKFYLTNASIVAKDQSMTAEDNVLPSQLSIGDAVSGGIVCIRASKASLFNKKALYITAADGSFDTIAMYGATTSSSGNPVKMRIQSDSSGLYGYTNFYGNKISIYSQDYNSTKQYGILEAGTVDLSLKAINTGLKLASINQIKVNNVGLQSSSLIQVINSTVKLCSTALTVTDSEVKIGNNTTINVSAGDIYTTGNITTEGGIVTATSFNATSDRRLKTNIIDYKPEKSILDLEVKKFDFINGPKNQIGCIAQDLQEICPEIVNEDKNGYLSIQENKLVYLLLDEVKKLKNEVEKLKNK